MSAKRLFILALLAAAILPLPAKEIAILTIGNSFSNSVVKELEQVAEAAGDKVVIGRAAIGGCPLNKHWELVGQSEADPALKPYQKKYNLRQLLELRKWDFVTIQQASHLSWQPGSYQPYAKNLQDYVKKYAPDAELVIQQTWAYRFDDARLGRWGIDQQEMYEKLRAAYDRAAKELGIRLIPAGDAVQLARETQQVKYVPYDPAVLKDIRYPAPLPSEAGSLVEGLSWRKVKGKDEYQLRRDPSHLNLRGRYLQACVWYGFFFDRPTSGIKYVPDGVAGEDAAFLRGVAQQALDRRRTP